MDCSECGVNIPPIWKHAYEVNYCPSCGGKVLDLNTVELMTELKKALSEMPDDPMGITGWLLSNYKMVKIGSAQPVTEFYGSKKQENKPKNQNTGSTALEQFLKRSGINFDPQKQSDLKSIVEEINGGPEDNDDDDISEDDVPEAQDEESIAYTLKALKAMKEPVKRNQKMDYNDDVDIDENRISSTDLEEGLQELPPILRKDRLKRLRSQNDLINGGTGKIRRSE